VIWLWIGLGIAAWIGVGLVVALKLGPFLRRLQERADDQAIRDGVQNMMREDES
jgi:hypothetical protein